MAFSTRIPHVPRLVLLQLVILFIAIVALAVTVANCILLASRLPAPVGAWQAAESNLAAAIWGPSLPPPILVMAWSATDSLYWLRTKTMHGATAFIGLLPLALLVVGIAYAVPQWARDLHDQSPVPGVQPGVYSAGLAGTSLVCFFILSILIVVYMLATAIIAYNNRYIIRLAAPGSRGSFGSGWTKVTVSSRRDSFGSRWSSYLTSPIQPPDKMDWPAVPTPAAKRVPTVKVSEVV